MTECQSKLPIIIFSSESPVCTNCGGSIVGW